MHPANPPSASSGASRLPRMTPVRPIDASHNSALAGPSHVERTPLTRNGPVFKQPRNPTVQALSLAIKKRYSVGKRGPPARSSPSTGRLGVLKRPAKMPAPPPTLGKRQIASNSTVPPKRPKVLSERNPVVPRKVVAGTSTENVKGKVQPWDIKGKLELAEQKIRNLTEEVQEKENRIKQLRDLTGSADEQINSLSEHLDEEKALSAVLRTEIASKNKLISELEEEVRKNSAQITEMSSLIVELRSCITGLNADVAHEKQKVQELTVEAERLHDLRKQLHNTVQDLKGNIRVFCRVRPPTHREKNSSSPLCYIEYEDLTTVEIYKAPDDTSAKQKRHFSFSFDRVFPANSSQEDIFGELEQLVQSCLDGYNVCVFAYGQTGSGKTHTMDGPRGDEAQKGMIPRTVETIFKRVEQLKQLGWQYSVEVFFVEIYNEQIRDLLNYHSSAVHEIRMVPNRKCEVFVTNLRVEKVESEDELNSLLELARNNRSVASTVCNTHSSRSHFIMKIAVNGTNAQRELSCYGSISLVDLAGSERYEDNNSLERRKETMNINKSLSSLANVILALKLKNDHIPYRVSKLTHLLMPCLSGTAKTLMIVNISPLRDCYSESVNSLRFANSVNQCRVVAKKNEKSTSTL